MGAATGPLVLTPPTSETPADISKDNRTRRYLSFYVFSLTMAYITWVTIKPAQLPGDTLGIILGALLALNGTTIGFYFTSSAGSSAKNTTKPPEAP